MDAARVRTVEALRERIGRLGGLPGRGTAAPRSSARPQPPDRDAVAPRQPGFVAEGVGEGTAWVRRVSIELRPFLERAGAAGPVAAAELLDLAYPGADLGRAGSTWDEVDVAVVDIESLGLRPMDTGQLPMARALENVALLQLGLVAHSVKHTNFFLGVSILS